MNSSSPQTISEPSYSAPLSAQAGPPGNAHGSSSGPTPLSRTDSATSFSSEDDASMSPSPVAVMNSSRRTRKRFTNTQLTMLENLFHLNSHPSREDREAVARDGGMEIKSVTIWFQNKRQTERKTAASNNGANGAHGGSSHSATSHAVPNITSTIHTFSLHGDSLHGQGPSSRTASPPFSISSRSSMTSTSTATSTTTAYSQHTSGRPSLDRVASRSELRAAAPRTPSRRPTHPGTGAIWDNMPSSPLAPPISPPAREFIDFGKNARTRRTLEWACAAARLVDKDGYASGMSAGFGAGGSGGAPGGGMYASSSACAGPAKPRARTVSREKLRMRAGQGQHQQSHHSHSRDPNGVAASTTMSTNSRSRERDMRMREADTDLTDDEDHEAITPPSTWGKDDRRWTPAGTGAMGMGSESTSLLARTEASKGGMLPKDIQARVDDDDMFKAALALCGLGRRT